MAFDNKNETEYIDKLDLEYEIFNKQFDEIISNDKPNYNRSTNQASKKLLEDGKLAQNISNDIFAEREEYDKVYNSLSENERLNISAQNTKNVNKFAKATKQKTVFIDTKKGGDNNE